MGFSMMRLLFSFKRKVSKGFEVGLRGLEAAQGMREVFGASLLKVFSPAQAALLDGQTSRMHPLRPFSCLLGPFSCDLGASCHASRVLSAVVARKRWLLEPLRQIYVFDDDFLANASNLAPIPAPGTSFSSFRCVSRAEKGLVADE